MSSRRAFIDLCVRGEIPPADIDDFIDQWHGTPEGIELHDYLGMTLEEYSLWLRVPDALPYIIKARHEEKPLADIVYRLTLQNKDKLQAARLRKWLKSKGPSI